MSLLCTNVGVEQPENKDDGDATSDGGADAAGANAPDADGGPADAEYDTGAECAETVESVGERGAI